MNRIRSSVIFWKIIRHILILCLLISSASWTYFVHSQVLATVLLSMLVVGEILWLFFDLNEINRKLTFFFEAVQNEDTSLHFPENQKSSTVRHLHHQMNRVNQLIQETKIKQIEQEQFFKLAMNHAATGLLTIDEEGFIPFANLAARDLLSYPQLSHVKQLWQVDTQLFDAIQQIQVGEKRLISFTRDKTNIHLSLYATSFTNQNETLRILAIQNLKSELEQKESDAWIKLIRVLSHEMINTIAPISSLAETLAGYYEHLLLENEADVSIKSFHAKNTLKGLKVIQERGQGLVEFVETYRQLTRLPLPQKETFLLDDLTDQLRILLSETKNATEVHLEIDIQPKNLQIFADKDQLSQALLNILLNAFQALEGQKDGYIRLQAYNSLESQIHIGITDNGPGIPIEHLSEIFIPFFTTKENGSGVGLSLSRQIIQQHGGTLEVYSIPGKETSFWVNGIR